jgi:hypothetical protein
MGFFSYLMRFDEVPDMDDVFLILSEKFTRMSGYLAELNSFSSLLSPC